MALPACFHLADEVFPRVRAEAARQMLASGASQSEAARRLGVSQAMISKYAGRPSDDDAVVLRLADELLHEGPASWCDLLGELHTPGHDDALRDLLAAEQQLLRQGTSKLVPQVGINLARALQGATSPDEVLAYPARIVAAGDRLVRPVAPALGASEHLARCLLALRQHDPAVHALINVHADALPDADATMAPEGDRIEAFAAALAAHPAARIIREPGAHGIEPCLYVAAVDAQHAIHTILENQ